MTNESGVFWPDFGAIHEPIEQLAALSRFYGGDPEFCLAGGGNTSLKIGDRIFIKASGAAMATIEPAGFVELDRRRLTALLESPLEPDEDAREKRFKKETYAARIHPERGQRPSVESVLHHIMPGAFTVHTHSTYVNMITCAQDGESIARELFGDEILWIPYTTPGFVLAKTLDNALRDYTARTGKPEPLAVIMGNHGLLVSAAGPEEIRAKTDRIVDAVRKRVGAPDEDPFGPQTRLSGPRAAELLRVIAPALRALLAPANTLKVVTFDDSPLSLAIACGAAGRETAAGGPLTPDQIVYCKSFPLWFQPGEGEPDDTLLTRLAGEVKAYEAAHGFLPHVVLAEGLGLFAAGDTYKAARTVRDVYLDAVKIMAGARRAGGVRYMTQADREFIEHWEVESYRRQIAAQSQTRGRAEGKIVFVTGAAQGFGLEIAKRMAADGGHVIAADVNASGAQAAAHALCSELGLGRALGVAIDVSDADSVRAAVLAAVRMYGGFDVFISNAGVLRAGSVKTQPVEEFEFVTDVNYKGYFICVQQAAPILERQHRYKPEYWSDIIQINSKSGLVGSNRNSAYAGGKFGGIGLTQSFALELVEDGVKVNAVCPGNFFDGPLWSDPEKGLFVQYLRSGKVPGAKTVEDVRRAYEAKVPMGRGCEAQDVMRAIYYLIEQQYETGQALPVTGGQVMLS